jgi:parallel beta-helix repeat protein
VKNGTIKNNLFWENGLGIKIDRSNENTICQNNFTNPVPTKIMFGKFPYYQPYSWAAILAGYTTGGSSSQNIIQNNSFSFYYVGMYLISCDDYSISNNSLEHNTYGIFLGSQSKDNTLWDNRLKDCSIFLWDDFNAFTTQEIFTNNTVNEKPVYYYKNADLTGLDCPVDAGEVLLGNVSNFNVRNLSIENSTIGIITGYCSNIEISNNKIQNCTHSGIEAYQSTILSIKENLIVNSTNGIELDYSDFCIIGNNTATLGRGQGILLQNSPDNIIRRNLCENNNVGILLNSGCNRIIIENNSCNDNEGNGIGIVYSDQNIISNNTCINNTFGFEIQYSISNLIKFNNDSLNRESGLWLEYGVQFNSICNNTFSENQRFGLTVTTLSSSNNSIWNNTFIGNNGGGIQVNDDGTNNRWNTSGSPHGYGNYWDDLTTPDNNFDWIVDWSYNLTGSAGAKDYYPRVNAIPVASFNISPLFGNISTVFNFNASGCNDLEDSSSLLKVIWDWENDGINDTQWSTVKTETHQFSTLGSHTIRLWVKDTKGAINTTIETIHLNTPPIASFAFTPSTGNQVTTFTFDASASSDLEDLNLSLQVRWDWTNDSVADTPWNTTKIATHSFASGGNYTVRLEVKDTDGLTSNTTRIVPVSDLATKEDIDRIMNYLNDLLRHINELETNLTALINQLKGQLNDTTYNITKLQVQLNQINASLTGFANQLQQQLDSLNAQVDKLEENLTGAMSNITKLLDQINTNLTVQVNQLEENLTGAMSNITKLQEQINKLNTDLTGFANQLQQQLDYLNTRLVAGLKNTSDQISSLILENEQLMNQNDRLQQELDEVNSSLSKRIDNATDRMDSNLQNSIGSLGWNMMIEWIAVFFALLVLILIVFRTVNVETQGAMRMIMEQKKSQIDVSKKKTPISTSSPGKESKSKRSPIQRKLAERKLPDDESLLPPEDTL